MAEASRDDGSLPHLHHDDRRLELDGSQFRELVNMVAAELAVHLDTLPNQQAWSKEGGAELARRVMEPMPWEAGEDLQSLVRRVIHDYTSVSFNTASPGYLAFVPGGGLPLSAIADLIASTINRFVTVWVAAPALAQLENTVVRWFAEMVGYPDLSGGYLTSGGSMANWSAVVTARRCQLGDDFQTGCLYVSDQAHHCIQKAAVLAGFPLANVRLIPTDDHFRIRLDALRSQIEADFNAGLRPFLLIGNAGTTNTGAIDDLQALAGYAAEYGLWFHIDAAYGGFFALTERGRQRMQGLHHSDSITLDPHKALFLPHGSGCLLVQRWRDLQQTHLIDGVYMPEMQVNPEFVDISTISPELSRDFRGLRIWLPLKAVGARTFAKQLDEKLDLCVWAARELAATDGIEIVAAPQLTTVAFRYHAPGLGLEELNQLNRQLLDLINQSQRFYITPTILNGRFVLRICILSFRTHFAMVEECIARVREAVAELAAA